MFYFSVFKRVVKCITQRFRWRRYSSALSVFFLMEDYDSLSVLAESLSLEICWVQQRRGATLLQVNTREIFRWEGFQGKEEKFSVKWLIPNRFAHYCPGHQPRRSLPAPLSFTLDAITSFPQTDGEYWINQHVKPGEETIRKSRTLLKQIQQFKIAWYFAFLNR